MLISVSLDRTSQLYHVYSYDIIVINTRTRVITMISYSYRGITITYIPAIDILGDVVQCVHKIWLQIIHTPSF